ncbi:MAG: HAD family phosphatase [Alphaproteobacteria bacterium]|nr:MAG: HAD family phosphatase [Alphaproteobacteria bacterium]
MHANFLDFDLIIFDCDGTLVDSTPVFYPALAEYLHDLGFPGYSGEQAEREFFALAVVDIYKILQSRKPLNLSVSDFIEDVGARYRRAMSGKVIAAPGIENLLSCIQDNGVTMRVASNGEIANIHAVLQCVGLKRYFADSALFSAEQVVNPKPAPDLYQLASAGFEDKKILAVEDSVMGIRSAKAAGLKVWGYTGFASNAVKAAQDLSAAGADYIIADFNLYNIAA